MSVGDFDFCRCSCKKCCCDNNVSYDWKNQSFTFPGTNGKESEKNNWLLIADVLLDADEVKSVNFRFDNGKAVSMTVKWGVGSTNYDTYEFSEPIERDVLARKLSDLLYKGE